MARLIFIPDIQEGHLLPTFGLARALANRGHDVHYLGIPHNMALVRKYGFDYHVIFSHIFTDGYMEEFKKTYQLSSLKKMCHQYVNHLIEESWTLDKLFEKIQPDILVTSSFITLGGLILHYWYKIPQLFLTPFIPGEGNTLVNICIEEILDLPSHISANILNFFERTKGLVINNLKEFAAPLEHMSQLITCPKEFTLPGSQYPPNFHFIEASIRKDAITVNTPCPESISIPGEKQVIYAAMGSQTYLFKKLCKRLFLAILEIMRSKNPEDWHLILSIGSEFEIDDFENIPVNVTMLKWAPQVDVLKFSSLAITHGGLGTVKECIFFGVPMIVLPLVGDQHWNAKLIECHKLGVKKDIDNLSVEELESSISYVLDNDSIQENMHNMQSIFQEKENAQLGAGLIEKLLN